MNHETMPIPEDPMENVVMMKFWKKSDDDTLEADVNEPFHHDGAATAGVGMMGWEDRFWYWFAALYEGFPRSWLEEVQLLVRGDQLQVEVYAIEGIGKEYVEQFKSDPDLDDYQLRCIMRDEISKDKILAGQANEVMFTPKMSDWVKSIDPRRNN